MRALLHFTKSALSLRFAYNRQKLVSDDLKALLTHGEVADLLILFLRWS